MNVGTPCIATILDAINDLPPEYPTTIKVGRKAFEMFWGTIARFGCAIEAGWNENTKQSFVRLYFPDLAPVKVERAPHLGDWSYEVLLHESSHSGEFQNPSFSRF